MTLYNDEPAPESDEDELGGETALAPSQTPQGESSAAELALEAIRCRNAIDAGFVPGSAGRSKW